MQEGRCGGGWRWSATMLLLQVQPPCRVCSLQALAIGIEAGRSGPKSPKCKSECEIPPEAGMRLAWKRMNEC